MRIKLLLLLAIVVPIAVYAQKPSKTNTNVEKLEDAVKIHKELDIGDSEDGNYDVVQVGANGMFLAYMPDGKAKNGMQDFMFKKLDVDFNEEFNISISMKKTFRIVTYCTDNDYVYFLFTEHATSKFKNFSLIKIAIKEKDSKTYLGLLEKDFYFKKMLVNKGIVHLGGEYGPSEGNMFLTECFSAMCCYIPKLFIHYKYFPTIINIDMKTKNGTRKEFKMENYVKGNVDFVDMDIADSTDEINFVVNHDYKKIE